MTSKTILPTGNTGWGFWGTMGDQAEAAWPLAFAAIRKATGCELSEVRAFLDSRMGRHFADEVSNGIFAKQSLPDAIGRATAIWMGWRIDRRTSRETGIPKGLPYLTGMVINEGMAADAAREENGAAA